MPRVTVHLSLFLSKDLRQIVRKTTGRPVDLFFSRCLIISNRSLDHMPRTIKLMALQQITPLFVRLPNRKIGIQIPVRLLRFYNQINQRIRLLLQMRITLQH